MHLFYKVMIVAGGGEIRCGDDGGGVHRGDGGVVLYAAAAVAMVTLSRLCLPSLYAPILTRTHMFFTDTRIYVNT
jgi:hypothetical protein